MRVFARYTFPLVLIFLLCCDWITASQADEASPAMTNAKIIGGRSALPGSWPWMVGLIHSGLSAWDGLFCGGTLIAENWVMTAAHCVKDITADKIEAVIGRVNLDSLEGEQIKISDIIVHPDFDPLQFYNDIALLKLEMASSYEPIETLDHFSIQDDAGTPAIALGWGSVSATDPLLFPNILQEVFLPIVSTQQCRQRDNSVTDAMLCAGYPWGGPDTCAGDSGGPLIVYDTESKRWRQAGITSFGFGACGQLGVYTRLEQFKTFISDTICTPDEVPQTPQLTLTANENRVTALWTNAPVSSEGYRLNYAPYPEMNPIYSLDMNQADEFSVQLNPQDAYYVAISAYNGNCRSHFSNVEFFVLP